MPEELFKLLVGLGLSIALTLVIVLPVIMWRAIKKKPLFPKGDKIESPKRFYIGIIVCGGFSLLAFLVDMPYFGCAIILMLLAFVCGLVAYKKGWI